MPLRSTPQRAIRSNCLIMRVGPFPTCLGPVSLGPVSLGPVSFGPVSLAGMQGRQPIGPAIFREDA